MGKPSIICVDDERMILDSLREQLKSNFGSQYNIEIAESSREALDIVAELLTEKSEIPLIISDYIMPDMKGDELLKQVRQANPHIVTVLLTGQATIEGVANAVNQAGVYKYIEKPWDKSNLLATVTQSLEYYYQDQLKEVNTRKLSELNAKLSKTIQQESPESSFGQTQPIAAEHGHYTRSIVEDVVNEITRSLQSIRYGVDLIHHQQKAIYEESPESMSIYMKSVAEFYQKTSEIFDYMIDAFEFDPSLQDSEDDKGDLHSIYRKTAGIGNRMVENVSEIVNNTYEVERQLPKNVDKIVAWDGEIIHLFNLDEVLFFTVEEGNTMVVTKKGKYKMRDTLNILETKLNQQSFFRCHKSFLINLRYISQIIPWIGNNYISKLDGFPYEIPISRNRLKEIKEILGI